MQKSASAILSFQDNGNSTRKRRRVELGNTYSEEHKLASQFQDSSKLRAKKKKNPPQTNNKATSVVCSSLDSFAFERIDSKKLIFPPTIHSHVKYSNGICLHEAPPRQSPIIRASILKGGQSRSDVMRDVYIPSNYVSSTIIKSRIPHGPKISNPQLWSHRFCAQEAARQGAASNIFRLLGTISRFIVVEKIPVKCKTESSTYFPVRRQKRTKITKSQAKAQAKLELRNSGNENYSNFDLEQKTKQIIDDWNGFCPSENIPKAWDYQFGHLHPFMVNDPHYVPLQQLTESCVFKECNPPEPVQLYNGLLEVDVRLNLLLESLTILQSPQGLYETPLVLSYPQLLPIGEADQYELKIAVYAHRLLPEVLTAVHLHRIVTALDTESFRLTQSLYLPPSSSAPSFLSSPSPKIVFEDEESENSFDKQIDEGGSHKISLRDPTIQDSTRMDSETLSAFTIPGLMKLWENTGNDTSNWPVIHAKLSSLPFKVDLMMHQKHAVCWMVQMESLKGFGINSILWEEREWLDGGKYYYSPAVGQIRLAPPPTLHGGILADEMGLGKTIMILGLIVATLDHLKNDKDRLHTTLIIVPPTLVGQWEKEIEFVTGNSLKTQFYDYATGQFIPDYDYVPDICITTYNALGRNGKHYRNVNCRLSDYKWGRIVLDEMQEIRSSTSQIAKACDKLDSPRRWMISGTPLFDGIGDLRGELNFLSLEPFAAKNEDGFFDFSIINHWLQHSKHALNTLKILGLFLLRRSKSMSLASTGEPIMGLKPLTIELVPISQSPYERALYCFLEFIVAKELEKSEKDVNRISSSRRFCLRILRELCISPVLVSGGLGVNSQLGKLNNLLVNYNRHDLEKKQSNDRSEGNRVLSCTEAIRYLSQIQNVVCTSADFVSGISLSHGGGITKRNRASTDLVAERAENCRINLFKSRKMIQKAKCTKAKAYWHLALERITMGKIQPCNQIKQSVSLLWKWRALVEHQRQHTTSKLPSILSRGWRPCESYLNQLLAAHPEFVWMYPGSLALNQIPFCVTPEEIKKTIVQELGVSSGFNIVTTSKCHGKFNWKAIVHFECLSDARALAQRVVDGVIIQTSSSPSFVQDELLQARTEFEEARSLNNVFPTIESAQRVKKAKKKYEFAKRGLQIVVDDENHDNSKHIRLGRAKREARSAAFPRTAKAFYSSTQSLLKLANEDITNHSAKLREQTKLLKNIEKASEVSETVMKMSAFETLEALSMKEWEKTNCTICLGHLGSSDPKCTDELGPGMVALTGCSHLFCAKCITDYILKANQGNKPKCPECRREIIENEFVFIDPSLSRNDEKVENERRSKAKKLIHKASKMLEESNGQLDSELWHQLYLAIDIPSHVPQRGNPLLSAIPKEIITFFRAATCMVNVNNKANAIPTLGNGFSTKIQALLHDIPRNERSVVFTGSNITVKHLMTVFEICGISYSALYAKQNCSAAERAVEKWKQSSVDKDGKVTFKSLVLIIQANSSSGLTLTASCKMFFLEPFVRQEEEQQALARCHRYGQIHPVHAKIYFSPVSVESRLLEWRKLSTSDQSADTKVVYSDIVDILHHEKGNPKEEKANNFSNQTVDHSDDVNQTMFLLGLETDS